MPLYPSRHNLTFGWLDHVLNWVCASSDGLGLSVIGRIAKYRRPIKLLTKPNRHLCVTIRAVSKCS